MFSFFKQLFQQLKSSKKDQGFGILIIFLLVCFPFVNLLAEASVDLFEKKTIQKQIVPHYRWNSYGLMEEGEFLLKIKDKDSKLDLEEFAQNIKVYVPANSLSGSVKENNSTIYTLSSEEKLIQLDLLQLLQEGGVSLSFKSKSPVYVISKNNQALPELQIYKIGPSKPIASS